jgi:hypothetical protein
MLARLQGRLTYANIVATLALFLALGGSAYGVAKIGSRDIKNRSLRGIDIRRNSLTGKEIRESSLGLVPHAGDAKTATNAVHAQNADSANTAAAAGVATNAQALGGLGADIFERSSRTEFGAGSSSPPNVASEGVMFDWGAIGVRVTAPAQGGCPNPAALTLRLMNTRTSGGDLHVFGGSVTDIDIPGDSSTVTCSAGSGRWEGVVTRDGDPRTLFFLCERLTSDVRCIGTRSEP